MDGAGTVEKFEKIPVNFEKNTAKFEEKGFRDDGQHGRQNIVLTIQRYYRGRASSCGESLPACWHTEAE